MATETEGKWFWEKDGINCWAVHHMRWYGGTMVAVCDLPRGHEGQHHSLMPCWFAASGHVWWNDREADRANRQHYRELAKAFNDVDLPYEDGI